MRIKSTERAEASHVSSQLSSSAVLPLSSPPSQPSVLSSKHPILAARSKRKLSELSLQNTSTSSIEAKSVFIKGRNRKTAELSNNKSNNTNQEDQRALSAQAENFKNQARVRVCGSGKLRLYTKIMVDRKTSTGSNSSQQSASNESSRSNNHHIATNSPKVTRRTVRRRDSSSLTLRQILLHPNQLPSRYSGVEWRILASPSIQNHHLETSGKSNRKVYDEKPNIRRNISLANVCGRRQLQKTMSLDDDDDCEVASIEDDVDELDEDEDEFTNADANSEEELYWLKKEHENGNEDDIIGDEDDDHYEDSEEAKFELPKKLVSSMRMMRSLTVSSPRHLERRGFMSHR